MALAGCGKKKVAKVPPRAVAPAITSSAPPAPPSPGPVPPVNAEPNRPMPPEPEVAKIPPPKPRITTSRRTPSQPAIEEGARTAPVPPPEPQPQLSAGLSRDDILHRKYTTAQLLESTEFNLKGLNRTLSADEQAIVQHIRSYVQQAREATGSGDVERAYNLAVKAHLLCDELIKR